MTGEPDQGAAGSTSDPFGPTGHDETPTGPTADPSSGAAVQGTSTVWQRVIVTAADEAMGHLDDLADRLRTAGMDVERVLGMGVITGSVPLERRAALVEVDGVAGVEDERTFSTPPPPSDIQ